MTTPTPKALHVQVDWKAIVGTTAVIVGFILQYAPTLSALPGVTPEVQKSIAGVITAAGFVAALLSEFGYKIGPLAPAGAPQPVVGGVEVRPPAPPPSTPSFPPPSFPPPSYLPRSLKPPSAPSI